MYDMNMQERKVDEIIERRRPFHEEIQCKQKNLQQQIMALTELKKQYLEIKQQGPQGMFSLIQGLSLTQLVDEMEAVNKELNKPMRRFARQTLNIGVIGYTGQGKSTLLQNLSGVGPEAIPTGSGEFCTGVRSVVRHNPDPNKVGGLISFYTQEELLHDVLALYYQRLNLGNVPQTFDGFISSPLPRLGENGALSRAMYARLQEYKDDASVYAKRLGAEDLPVPIKDVRKFVAQDSLDGRQKYYDFMAVKEAVITTNFGQEGVRRVALVDMPGLGDTRVGDDYRLMQALGEEVDVVLFLVKPDKRAVLRDYDIRLYDQAYESMGENIPIKDWLFMVLNYEAGGDKRRVCRDLQDIIEGKNSKHGTHTVEVVKCIVANCNDKAETAQVLTSVLEHR
jgi:energy-coupling factor transporter ATP-binding protein EcfA2